MNQEEISREVFAASDYLCKNGHCDDASISAPRVVDLLVGYAAEALRRSPSAPMQEGPEEGVVEAIKSMRPPSDPHSNAWVLGFCRAREMAADLAALSTKAHRQEARPTPADVKPVEALEAARPIVSDRANFESMAFGTGAKDKRGTSALRLIDQALASASRDATETKA